MRTGADPNVLRADAPESLAATELALLAGDIVGIPTETVYGLAVLPTVGALDALIRTKQRSSQKGIALLIDGIAQLDDLVELPPTARRLAASFWPGPLTLVLPLRGGVRLPDAVSGGGGTLGVRVPDHVVPRTLARRLGPLAATSANRSGSPESLTAAALVEAVGDSVALVLDDGPVRGGVASSVVAVTRDGTTTLLREGALLQSDIEHVLARSR